MTRYASTPMALRAALGTPLEPAAAKLLAAIVMQHITNDAIAAALGCDPRTVRRLLPLYGWPNRAWSPPKRKPVKDRFKGRGRASE